MSNGNGNRTAKIVALVIGGGCLLMILMVGFLFFVGFLIGFLSDEEGFGDRVALIRVTGVITGGRSGGDFFSVGSGAERVVEMLEKARKDDRIRAVVLRINSPGGSAAGSEEIYRAIEKVRREKPVIASMADVAASGGYYIAAPCDRILADGATLTGSIGVIMELENFQGLFKKLGIDFNVIKSGKMKDIGNPARPMTPEERQLIQTMVNDIYNQFVQSVVKGRRGKLTEAQVRRLADGRIFTGRQALRERLVDQIGGLEEAIRVAAREGGIKGEPVVQEIGKPRFLDLFSAEAGDSLSETSRELLRDHRMQELLKMLQ